MFVEERQALIVEELHEKGRVKVKELSERFQVSEDLIRKDLSVLEQNGQLKKAYGGAVMVKENVHREIAAQRKHVYTEEKKKIAKLALPLVKDGHIVFLDISTVNIELAQLLVKQGTRATIVTNMLEVVNILAKSEVNVIFIGGELDYGRDGFVGAMAMEMLRHFRFDIAFMGVVGVDVHEDAVITYTPGDGVTKKEVLTLSRTTYMLCETEKFNQLGNYQFARLEDFSGIITNAKLPKDIEKALDKRNVKVIFDKQ